MTTRSDATPLPVEDRSYLIESALNMIEEGLGSIYNEALDEGVHPDDHHLLESLEEMRLVSYASLLQTMVTDRRDAEAVIKLMRERNNHLNP